MPVLETRSRHHSEGSPESNTTNNIPEYILDYFTRMEYSLRQVEFDFDSGENINPDVTKVFVPLPTNIEIGVKVRGRRIVAIIENNVSYDGVTPNKYSSFFDGLNNVLLHTSSQLPLVFRPYWKDGVIHNFFSLNAIEAITSLKKCAVLGSPGSGKSMLLQFLTLILIEQYKSGKNLIGNYSNSSLLYEEMVVPIYVPLRKMFKDNNERTSGIEVEDFLRFVFGDTNLPNIDKMKLFFKTNKFIFLFDGVDEIFPESQIRASVNCLINVVNTLTEDSRIVFSSRIEQGKNWIPLGFTDFTLAEMDLNSKFSLADNTFKEKGYSDYKNQRKLLFDEIMISGLDKKITGTPLFFSLIIYIYISRGSLPTYKSLILEDGVKLLISRWRQKILEIQTIDRNISHFYDINNLLSVLEEIAFTTVIGDTAIRPNSLVFPSYILDGKIIQILKNDARNYSESEVAEISFGIKKCLIENIGIIRERSNDSFGVTECEFAHRNFQEYLAAKRLSNPQFFNQSLKRIFDSNPRDYQEVLLMLIEILHDTQNYNMLFQFILMIINKIDENTYANSWWSWFSSRIISCRDYSLLLYVEEFRYLNSKSAISNVCKHVAKSCVDSNLRIECRIECARFLSELTVMIKKYNLEHIFEDISEFGDTRRGVGIDENGLPDIYWCRMEGGNFILGLTERDERKLFNDYPGSSFEREMPCCEIHVAPFFISRYPITFNQYRAFYDDGAYENERFWNWSSVSLMWFRQKRKSINPEKLFNNSGNAPVVNISWIEAKSFCEWLSYKLNRTIRLPYEYEWEFAAKKIYDTFSISDHFDENIYVSNALQLNKAAPVGIFLYPDDMPCDMNGNVWEWTQSIMLEDETLERYLEHFDDINITDFSKLQIDAKMVVKGGCFLNSSFQSRNTYRGRDYVFNHIMLRQGFRIVMDMESYNE